MFLISHRQCTFHAIIVAAECMFVAFVVQNAKNMGPITLSSVVCLALTYFSTLPHKWHNFFFFLEKKVTVHKMCVLIFSTTPVKTLFNLRIPHKATSILVRF